LHVLVTFSVVTCMFINCLLGHCVCRWQ